MLEREINYLVLSRYPDRAETLAGRLRGMGCRAERVDTAEEALERSRNAWTCVVFDRALTDTLEEFFAPFPTVGVCFAPWSARMDYFDIVNSLNSHRCAYYLVDTVPDGELEKLMDLADWQLYGRLREVGMWTARRRAETRQRAAREQTLAGVV